MTNENLTRLSDMAEHDAYVTRFDEAIRAYDRSLGISANDQIPMGIAPSRRRAFIAGMLKAAEICDDFAKIVYSNHEDMLRRGLPDNSGESLRQIAKGNVMEDCAAAIRGAAQG